MTRKAVIVASLLLIAVTGCVETSSGRTAPQAADWAGFTERAGLHLSSAEDVGRLDAAVRFTVEGSISAIDDALEAAGFTTALTSGADQVQAGLFGGEVTQLSDVRSAVDQWRSPSGTTIHRHVVVGTRDDSAVLTVAAFTT